MTNKQKIRAEIVRRIGNILQVGNEAYLKCHLLDLYYAKRSYESLLSFIDSMPQEPVCEDLNKEFNRFIVNEEGVSGFLSYEKQIEWGLDIARHFVDWQKQQDEKFREDNNICCMKFEDIDNSRIGAYEEGKAYMREEIMKDAVEAIVYKGLYSKYVKERVNESLSKALENYNPGDKVKIIIIKKD